MWTRFGIALVAAGAALAQSTVPAPQPAFIAADVHPSPRSNSPMVYMTGGALRGSRYDVRNASMVDLIRTAWRTDPDRIFGGPNWLEFDRFDIVAKAPPKTSRDDTRLMLRALLADRFQLVVHEDTRPMPVFALAAGKGKPKLKESAGEGNSDCEYIPQKADSNAPQQQAFACRNITMGDFARRLRNIAGDYITSPLIDSTDLKGSWDFDIRWTPRYQLAKAGSDAVTISDALEKQLGLRLEQKTAPTSVLAVESVNEKPTPNAPDIASILPPPPPLEFDVATIKLSAPGTAPFGKLEPGGRVDLHDFTVKVLIQIAWNLQSDELIENLPKFADSTHYDVVAKAAPEATPANGQQLDENDARRMLQALLADRFKLATHFEDRPVNSYTLVAAKSKLKKADPANRTRWKEGPAPASSDPRDKAPILSRLVTCQNMTMAQFAAELPRMASGYIHSPVIDETGLDGAYDFTINFSPSGVFRNSNAPPNSSQQPGAAAADPNGATSLFEAVEKQLGLKLEMHKRPAPVLVVDHLEERPTEN